ncbi:hypothetical protein ACWCP6_35870 [Streptomyces sp. NPDC002004]
MGTTRSGLSRLAAGAARVAGAGARAGSVARENLAWFRDSRRARHLYRDLGMRAGQGFPALVDAVARRRGRLITVLQLALPPDVSGFCVQGGAQDLIVLNTRDSERQRLHSGVHELYHVLCAGRGHGTEGPVTAGSFLGPGDFDDLPSLPPDVVGKVLSQPAQLRSHCDDDEERGAEVFATVVLPLLDLNRSGGQAGAINSSFFNRRSEV